MPAQTFTLTPHPANENQSALHAIRGQISRTADGLMMSYVLKGDLAQLCVPEQIESHFTDELWRHTCFELFIARKGEPQYYEFNFSPSGECAAYAFARYRDRIPLDANMELAAIDPRVTVCRSPGKLELDAVIRLGLLSPRYLDTPLTLGVSAVIEASDGSLSYWALTHPLDRPDFHHPDGFVLELDEIRN